MPLIPDPSMAAQRHALKESDLKRADYLIAVAEGILTILDVIQESCAPGGRPLLKINLRQLVLSEPSTSAPNGDAFLRLVAEILEVDIEVGNRSIAWLVDPRSGGRRLSAWLDVMTGRGAPWPGFPWSQAPPTHGLSRRESGTSRVSCDRPHGVPWSDGSSTVPADARASVRTELGRDALDRAVLGSQFGTSQFGTQRGGSEIHS